jgi:hypothetical protein
MLKEASLNCSEVSISVSAKFNFMNNYTKNREETIQKNGT